MKKGIKFLLGVIVSIVLSIGVLIVLVVKQIIPNPFLDTSDLVCSRIFYEVDSKSNQILTIKFNKKGLVEQILLNEEIKFEELKDAEVFYNQMKISLGTNWEKYLTIEGNKIIITKDDYILTKDEIISKKQIKKDYEEALYECK